MSEALNKDMEPQTKQGDKVIYDEVRQPPPSLWKKFRSRKLGMLGLSVVIFVVLIAILAPWIMPYDPYEQRMTERMQLPSAEHWLGTDLYGRDMLSRIMLGARTSLTVSLGAVSISALVGVTIGMLAGFRGGWFDDVVMRIVEALMAIPALLLALVVLVSVGSSMAAVIAVIGIAMLPGTIRIARAETLEVKEKEYIKAAIATGNRSLRILLRHVLPNITGPVLVILTIQSSAVILIEASLGFLGMGVQPPTPTWGNMINEGFQYLTQAPQLAVIPGLAIVLVSLAFNLVGDALRDAVDPHVNNQRN